MATIYVSQSATNGYAVGNDSNDGSTKALAKLTLGAAQTEASASDTIKINDGAYSEDISLSKNLTWEAENTRAVTITNSNGADSRVLNLASGVSVTLTGLIVDAENSFGSVIRGGTGASSLTVTDCTIRDGNNYGIYAQGSLSVWDTTILGDMNNAGITHQPATNGDTLTVSDNTIIIGSPDSTAGVNMIPAAGVTGVVGTITDNHITVRVATGNPTGISVGISTTNRQPDSVFIKGNMITLSGSVTPTGVVINDDTTLAMSSATVVGNTLLNADNAAPTGGYGVLIGQETSGAYQGISGARIHQNIITGFDHGAMIGYQTDGLIYGNTITGCVLSVLLDGCTTSWGAGNIVLDPIDTGSALRFQDCTNCRLANNTVEISDAYGGAALEHLDDLATGSANQFISNWVLIQNGGSVGKAVEVGAGETGRVTFTDNNYYDVNGDFVSGDFDYGGVAYDFTGWQTNAESTATNNAAIDNSGTKWWGDSAPEDYTGEPFPCFDISIGARQDKTAPFHPENL
jgi:hypothetical protein